MSLRREIHAAFESIAPPLGGMPERVVQEVLANKRRQRKEVMVWRIRAPLTLVAAVLFVAVIAAAVVTWNSLHADNASPAGDVGLTQLQMLETRPLHIPVYKTMADCVPSPLASPYGYGSPVAGYGMLAYTTDWGYYFRDIFYTDQPIAGAILIRGRDIHNAAPSVYVGDFASGPVVGTDMLSGTRVAQHREIVLNENQLSTNFASDMNVPTGKRFIWQFITGVPKTYSGYIGWQIDAVGLSELVLRC